MDMSSGWVVRREGEIEVEGEGESAGRRRRRAGRGGRGRFEDLTCHSWLCTWLSGGTSGGNHGRQTDLAPTEPASREFTVKGDA